jgi:hypothetical protein
MHQDCPGQGNCARKDFLNVFRRMPKGFLKAVGRKPSGEGSSVVFHARTLGKPMDIRLTGQLALLRYHLPITRKCSFINVPI